MRRKQKRIISITTIIVAILLITGYGVWFFMQSNNVDDNTEIAQNQVKQDVTLKDSEVPMAGEEKTDTDIAEMSPEELFQAFCDGKIKAEARSYYDNTTWTMDNTYFQFEDSTPEEELDVTMLVEKMEPVDLDNDGEVEFILQNPVYGDMCFDCKDGKVVCFSQGEGTAAMCSYTKYDGAYWIVHSDTTHGGRCTYELSKFNGDLEVTDSLRFGWEDWEDTGVKSYYKDDNEISETEYEELYKIVFEEK
jgi:hypothetical protein